MQGNVGAERSNSSWMDPGSRFRQDAPSRSFLIQGGAMAVAAGAAAMATEALADGDKFAHKLQFTAEGAVDPSYVLAVPPLISPPGLPPGFGPPRAAMKFPWKKHDVLETFVFFPSDPPGADPLPISLFGDLTGRAAAVSGGFTVGANGNATFNLLGGIVAGSHATFLPTAAGTLRMSKHWHD